MKENFSYYPKYLDLFLTLLQTLAAITRSTSYFDFLVTLLSEPCDYIGPAWIIRIISHLMILNLITPVKSLSPHKVTYSQVWGIRIWVLGAGHSIIQPATEA